MHPALQQKKTQRVPVFCKLFLFGKHSAFVSSQLGKLCRSAPGVEAKGNVKMNHRCYRKSRPSPRSQEQQLQQNSVSLKAAIMRNTTKTRTFRKHYILICVNRESGGLKLIVDIETDMSSTETVKSELTC